MSIPTPKFDIYDTVTFLSKDDPRIESRNENPGYFFGREIWLKGVTGKIISYKKNIIHNNYAIVVEFVYPHSFNKKAIYILC